MVAELHGPARTQLKEHMLNKTIMEFKLFNSEVVTGRVLWNDSVAYAIEREDGKQITVLNNAVLYYNVK